MELTVRWRRNVVLLVLALLLVVGALFWWWPGNDQSNGLITTPVERGAIESLVTATGILQPRTYVDVGAQVSGQLETLHVQVGEEVEKGDLLAEIDPTVYIARVDGTRAQLRNQQAQLRDREAQLSLAELQLQRQKNLFEGDATTREALQSAEASRQSAEAQIDALAAQIEQTESTLRAEEANLEYARIYAPIDGTVVTIDARQGQTLNASQTTPLLMRIADLATMTVQAQVSEADISQLEPGMPVYFTTLGNQGRRWHGELKRIEPTPLVENNVVLYNALFDVPNNGGQLLPQMTAQVFFVVARANDVLRVPVSAVRPLDPQDRGRGEEDDAQSNGRLAQVQVINPQGRPEIREVRIGVTDRVQAEVLSGLEEGDEVLVAGMGASQRRNDESGRLPRMMR